MKALWRIVLLDTKDENPNHYLALAIEEALRRHPDVETVVSGGNHDAIPLAIENSCNLFIAFDGEELDRGLCRRLASICEKSALWLTEDPYERGANIKSAPLFDAVFTNDSASVGAYPRGAIHLPLAASSTFHEFEVPDRDDGHFLYDLLFVGTAWPNRVKLLSQILGTLEGIKVKIALPRNEHLPVPEIDLPASAYIWRVPNSEMARMANRSRIVLTVHRDFSGSGGTSVARTPGPRLFEAALAGSFQLVDLAVPETANYFEPGREIAGFVRPEECVEQVRYYLSRPEERLAMARLAQTRCRREHLYDHRVANLLRSLEALPPRYNAPAMVHPLRVLFVVHNVVPNEPFGGVEVYVDLLSRHLPPEFEPFLYYPDRASLDGRCMVVWDVRSGDRHTFQVGSMLDPGCLSDAEHEVLFGRVLHEHRIDLVHFHHFIAHPWSLALVARTCGVPTVFTAHDYYPICTHFNLLNERQVYCNAPELPLSSCDLCLRHQDGAEPGTQRRRRAYVSSILKTFDAITFPSKAAREIVAGVYPFLLGNSRVSVEGIPIEAKAAYRDRKDPERLKVAIPGSFNRIKGGEALCKIFDALREDPLDFHVYGPVQPPYAEILEALGIPNLTLHGTYDAAELHAELSTCDLALLLPVWPETFLLTLSECWRAQVVPIVADVGAPAERVTHRKNGIKVPVDQPGAVVHVLRELLADRQEIERIRTGITQEGIRYLPDHVATLTGLYQTVTRTKRWATRSGAFFEEPPRPRMAGARNVYRALPDLPVAASVAEEPPLEPPERTYRIQRVQAFMRQHGLVATVKHTARKLLELSK